MRAGAVLVGLLSWTAAVLVPSWYVVGMAKAAVREGHHTYTLDELLGKFTAMPWPLWVYLIVMTVVGTLLVVGGLRPTKPGQGDDLSV